MNIVLPKMRTARCGARTDSRNSGTLEEVIEGEMKTVLKFARRSPTAETSIHHEVSEVWSFSMPSTVNDADQ
jgi:hypothetical protein